MLKKLVKKEKRKKQKLYPTNSNFIDNAISMEGSYQTLLMILLKKFMMKIQACKKYVHTDNKKYEECEIKYKDGNSLNTQILKMI